MTTTKNGVTIVAHHNLPSRLAADASALYARNIYNFVELLSDQESKQLAIDWDDEIVKGTLVIKDGALVHPALTGEPAPAKAPTVEKADEKADDKDAGSDSTGKGA